MWARWSATFRPVWEATAVGLLLGFIDCHSSGNPGFTAFAYLICGAILGVRHASRSFLCWLPLGLSLYAVHVVAIAFGSKPPYVEENHRFAEQCLLFIIPSGLGTLAGSAIRVGLSTLGWFRRESGPPVRFLPRTTREVLVAVACVGIGLGCLQRASYPPTIFAAGYDEARFHAIREGMTAAEVIGALGDPLRKDPLPGGEETWAYSEQYTYTSNYDRRWIIFKGGLVFQVIGDYWID